mmetsp:Transcript_3559/g.8031  ORF Transcript_3559/g.8031 Transcript_3559/m.8031 type:complete len:204 (+) Transcript_3559:2974-3585(+)
MLTCLILSRSWSETSSLFGVACPFERFLDCFFSSELSTGTIEVTEHEEGVSGLSTPKLMDMKGVFMRERGLRELLLESVSTSLSAPASSAELTRSTGPPSSSPVEGLLVTPAEPESEPLLLEDASVQPARFAPMPSPVSSWCRRHRDLAGVDPARSWSKANPISSSLSRRKLVWVLLFQGRIAPSAAATSITWSPAAKLTPLS